MKEERERKKQSKAYLCREKNNFVTGRRGRAG
jgi:hypothetical protein